MTSALKFNPIVGGCEIQVDGTAVATFKTAGNGFAIPAAVASGDAVRLSQLSTGTAFSPNIGGSTAAGTPTYAANGQVGRYSRIGDRCFCQIWLDWTNIVGATGVLVVRDLPIPSANITGLYASASIGQSHLLSITAGNYLTAYLPPNSTTILLVQVPTGGGTSLTVPIDVGGALVLSIEYFV